MKNYPLFTAFPLIKILNNFEIICDKIFMINASITGNCLQLINSEYLYIISLYLGLQSNDIPSQLW